jgi:signal transduction histidine kinase
LPFSYRPINRKRFTVVLATFFFLFGLILLISFFLFSNWMIDQKENEQFRTESYLQMDGKTRFIDLYLGSLSRSLKSIAYNPYFLSYVVDPKHLNQAEFLFLTIMLEHDDYMQLRFIGADGVEKLRFDRDRVSGYPYKKGKLQDKSDRYYFKEAAKLPEGEIYSSKIDFNVENGKVVQPFVPVFRVSVPIYFQEKFQGVLTINTFAQTIVSLFTDSPIYETTLFDTDGFLIFSKKEYYDKSVNPKMIWDILPIQTNDVPKKSNQTFLCEKNKVYAKTIPMGTEFINVAFSPKPNTVIAFGQEDYKIAMLVLGLLFLGAFPLSYLLSRPIEHMFDTVTRQQEELRELTHTLEERVAEKTEENARKDRLIIHQARLAELGEMIGNIAHQWRHPLTRLSLILQNLKALNSKAKLTPDKLTEMLTTANEQIFFMSDTIDNFKDFYKPSGEQVTFNAREAYDKVIDIIGYDLTHKNITVTCESDTTLPLYGNPNELSQVLLNLIGNARDALLERNVEQAIISLTAHIQDDQAIITVTDNAGGIPVDHFDRIFEPYFSTKAEKGTGIGLYMVRTIIQEKFDGTIEVTNTQQGAQFTLTLPTEALSFADTAQSMGGKRSNPPLNHPVSTGDSTSKS